MQRKTLPSEKWNITIAAVFLCGDMLTIDPEPTTYGAKGYALDILKTTRWIRQRLNILCAIFISLGLFCNFLRREAIFHGHLQFLLDLKLLDLMPKAIQSLLNFWGLFMLHLFLHDFGNMADTNLWVISFESELLLLKLNDLRHLAWQVNGIGICLQDIDLILHRSPVDDQETLPIFWYLQMTVKRFMVLNFLIKAVIILYAIDSLGNHSAFECLYFVYRLQLFLNPFYGLEVILLMLGYVRAFYLLLFESSRLIDFYCHFFPINTFELSWAFEDIFGDLVSIHVAGVLNTVTLAYLTKLWP